MFPKIVSILAPFGAALAIVCSSLTGYSILLEIGTALDEDQSVVLPTGYLVGAIGLLLFGLGVTALGFSSRTRSTPVICLFVGGMIAFELAAFLIGYGNWIVYAAFESLGTAERIDSESFIREAGKARGPLLVGWCFVLGGAVSIFAADVIAQRTLRSRAKSVAGGIAIALAFGALLIFLMSGVWSMTSLRGLEGDFSSPQSNPTSIASGVAGVINSAFLTVIGIVGCSFTSLLLAVATVVPEHQSDDEQI